MFVCGGLRDNDKMFGEFDQIFMRRHAKGSTRKTEEQNLKSTEWTDI